MKNIEINQQFACSALSPSGQRAAVSTARNQPCLHLPKRAKTKNFAACPTVTAFFLAVLAFLIKSISLLCCHLTTAGMDALHPSNNNNNNNSIEVSSTECLENLQHQFGPPTLGSGSYQHPTLLQFEEGLDGLYFSPSASSSRQRKTQHFVVDASATADSPLRRGVQRNGLFLSIASLLAGGVSSSWPFDSIVAFAEAARPPDCSGGAAQAELQTIALAAADTDYRLVLSCDYQLGLVLQGAVSNTVLTRVAIVIANAKVRAKFELTATLTFGAGSSLIVRDSEFSEMAGFSMLSKVGTAAAHFSYLRNNFQFNAGSISSNILIATNMQVRDAPGSTLTIAGNTFEAAAGVGTSFLLRMALAVTTGNCLQTLIEDNSFLCNRNCVDLSGGLNLTVRRNAFRTRVAQPSPYTLLSTDLSYGTVNWDAGNTASPEFAMTIQNSANTPLRGPMRFALAGMGGASGGVTRAYSFDYSPNGGGGLLAEHDFFVDMRGMEFSGAVSIGAASVLSPTPFVALANATFRSTIHLTGHFTGSTAATVFNFSGLRLFERFYIYSFTFHGTTLIDDCVGSDRGHLLLSTYAMGERGGVLSVQRNSFSTTTNDMPIRIDLLYTASANGDSVLLPPPTLIVKHNTVNAPDISSSGVVGIRLSSAARPTPIRIEVTDNTIFIVRGTALQMASTFDADVIVQRNTLMGPTSVANIAMDRSRLIFDDSNTFPNGVGSLEVKFVGTAGPAPLSGSVVTIRDARLSSILFDVKDGVELGGLVIDVRRVIIVNTIVLALRKSPSPSVTLDSIYCLGTSGAISSYQFAVAGNWTHSGSVYSAGLNLDVASSGGAIEVSNIVATGSPAAGVITTWTLAAASFIAVRNNSLSGAVCLAAAQTAADHRFVIERNTVVSVSNTHMSCGTSSLAGYGGLLVSWDRRGGAGVAQLRIAENAVDFSSSDQSYNPFALHIDSSVAASSVTNAQIYISNNSLSGGEAGSALKLSARNADVVLSGNALRAAVPTTGSASSMYYLQATLTGSRIVYDTSNALKGAAGHGTIAVTHAAAEAPRAGSVFSLQGIHLFSVAYSVLYTPTASSQSHAISVADVLLARNIVINTAAASFYSSDGNDGNLLPQLKLVNISTAPASTTESSYSVGVVESFSHRGCSYHGGLRLDVRGARTVRLSDLTVGRSSEWLLAAAESIEIRGNRLRNTFFSFTQSALSHAVAIEDNYIFSNSDLVGGVRGGAVISWTRATAGTSSFRIVNNTIVFDPAISSTAYAIILTSAPAASANTNAMVLIANNTVADTFGASAMSLTVNDGDITVVGNSLNTSNTYLLAKIARSRITFDTTNRLGAGEGLIDIVTTNPRDANVFAVASARLKSIKYQHAPTTTAVSSCDSVSLVDVDVELTIIIDLAASQLPSLVLDGISTRAPSARSSVIVRTVDFIHRGGRYAGQLDLTIEAPRIFVVDDVVIGGGGSIGAVSRWTVTASTLFSIANCRLTPLEISLTQNSDDRRFVFSNNSVEFAEGVVGLRVSWARQGLVGRAFAEINNNSIAASGQPHGNTKAIELSSTSPAGSTAEALALITIVGNRLRGSGGYLLHLPTMERADVRIERNIYATGGYGIFAGLTSCRVRLDITDPIAFTGPVAGGGAAGQIDIRHYGTPLGGSFVNVSFQQFESFYYNVPTTTAAPIVGNTFYMTNVSLRRSLYAVLGGNTAASLVFVQHVDTGADDKSTLQFKDTLGSGVVASGAPPTILNYSNFRGGLDLTIDTPLFVVIHNVALGAAVSSTFALTAGVGANISRCSFASIAVDLTSSNATLAPLLIFEDNVVYSRGALHSNYKLYHAVIVDWKRPTQVAAGAPKGTAIIRNNFVNFTAGASAGGSVSGIVFIADAAATATVADFLITGNTVRQEHGNAFYMLGQVRANVTFRNNVISVENPAGFVLHFASNVMSRVEFGESNALRQHGGGIRIAHSGIPLGQTHVRLIGDSIGSFHYEQPDSAAAATYADIISLTRVTITTGAIVVRTGYAFEPTVVLDTITAAARSTYQIRTPSFLHSGGRYAGGLDVFIDSPLFAMNSLVVGAQSVWTVTSGQIVNVTGNTLAAVRIAPTMPSAATADPTVIFENNVVVASNDGTYSGNIYAVCLVWSRYGVGSGGRLSIAGNSVRFEATRTGVGFYIFATTIDATRAASIAATFTRNDVLVSGSGMAIQTDLSSAAVAITNNALLSTDLSGYTLHATLRDASLVFDMTNTLSLNGGGIYVTHPTAQRNGNRFNVSGARLNFIRYALYSTVVATSTNDAFAITNVYLANGLQLLLYYSETPAVTLQGIEAVGARSTITIHRADRFVLRDSSFSHGLDLDVTAPERAEMYNLKLEGATSQFVLGSSAVASVHHCAFTSVRIITRETTATTVQRPSIAVYNNSALSRNDLYSWQTSYAIGYCFLVMYDRAQRASAPTMTMENNTCDFTPANVNSRGIAVLSTSGDKSPMRLVVRFNTVNAGTGTAVELNTDNTDVTVQRNALLGSGGTATFFLAQSRVTYDDTNSILPFGAGAIRAVHSGTPQNGSVFIVTGKSLAGLEYITPETNIEGRLLYDTTVSIERVVLSGALTVSLRTARDPLLRLDTITAAKLSTINVAGVAEFAHGVGCVYSEGLHLKIDSKGGIALRGLTVGGTTSTWTFAAGSTGGAIEVTDNVLAEVHFNAATNGVDPRMVIARNNITTLESTRSVYIGGYPFQVMFFVAWARTGRGAASFVFEDNRVEHLSVRSAANAGARSIRFDSYEAVASTVPMTVTVSRNYFKSLSFCAFGANVIDAEITFKDNYFHTNNAVSGGFSVHTNFVSNGRIVFDESNTIVDGSAQFYVNHEASPRRANLVHLRAGTSIEGFSYTIAATGGRAQHCDRVILSGVSFAQQAAVSVGADVINAEYTMWGVRTGTAGGQSVLRIIGALVNSTVRAEWCIFGAGLTAGGYTASRTSVFLLRDSQSLRNSVLAIGGGHGVVEVQRNNFSTTTGVGVAVQWQTAEGELRASFSRNRIVLTGTATVSMTMTCTAFSSPEISSNYANATYAFEDNILTGSGANTLVACRGIAVVRRNTLNPTSSLTLTAHTANGAEVGASLIVDASNVFRGCGLSFATSGVGGLAKFDVDIRYTTLTQLVLNSGTSGGVSVRLRLDTVHVTGPLTINADASASSVIVVDGCVVTGSSLFEAKNVLPHNAAWQVRRSQLAGGITFNVNTPTPSVLFAPEAAFVIASNFISQGARVVTGTRHSVPLLFANNTISTPNSETYIEVRPHDAIAHIVNNTFNKEVTGSKLKISTFGVSSSSGGSSGNGVVIASNTFAIPTTIVGTVSSGNYQIIGNSFRDTASIQGAPTMVVHVVGNSFSNAHATTFTVPNGAYPPNSLVAACNTNASGPMRLSTINGNFVDLACAESSHFGFCWGATPAPAPQFGSSPAMVAGGCHGGALPEAEAVDRVGSQWSWESVPTTFPSADAFVAHYGATLAETPWAARGACPMDPFYEYRGAVWPPPEPTAIPTTAGPTTEVPSTTVGPTLTTVSVTPATEGTTATTTPTTTATTKEATTTTVPTTATPAPTTAAITSTSTTTTAPQSTAATTTATTTATTATSALTTASTSTSTATATAATTDAPTTAEPATCPTAPACVCPTQPTASTTFPMPTLSGETSPIATLPPFVTVTNPADGSIVTDPSNGNPVTVPNPSIATTVVAPTNAVPTLPPFVTVTNPADGSVVTDPSNGNPITVPNPSTATTATPTAATLPPFVTVTNPADGSIVTDPSNGNPITVPNPSIATTAATTTTGSETTVTTAEGTTTPPSPSSEPLTCPPVDTKAPDGAVSVRTRHVTLFRAATVNPVAALGAADNNSTVGSTSSIVATEEEASTAALAAAVMAEVPTSSPSSSGLTLSWAVVATDKSSGAVLTELPLIEGEGKGAAAAVAALRWLGGGPPGACHMETYGVGAAHVLVCSLTPAPEQWTDLFAIVQRAGAAVIEGSSGGSSTSSIPTLLDRVAVTVRVNVSFSGAHVVESGEEQSIITSATSETELPTAAMWARRPQGQRGFARAAVAALDSDADDDAHGSVTVSEIEIVRTRLVLDMAVRVPAPDGDGGDMPFSTVVSTANSVTTISAATNTGAGTTTATATGNAATTAITVPATVTNAATATNHTTTVATTTSTIAPTSTNSSGDDGGAAEDEDDDVPAEGAPFEARLRRALDGTGLFFFGDPFSLEVHLAAAFLNAPCATRGDRAMGRYARYILSPLADEGAATVGLAHSLAAGGAFALYTFVVFIYARRRQCAFVVGCRALLFPSVPFAFAFLLLPGALVAAADLIRRAADWDGSSSSSSLSATDCAALALALAHTLCVLAAAAWALWCAPARFYGFYRSAKPPTSPTGEVSLGTALFRPVGVWDPHSHRALFGMRWAVRGNSVAGGKGFVLAAILFAIAFIFVITIGEPTKVGCSGASFAVAALSVLAAAAVAVCRPAVTRFANIATVVALCGVALLALQHGIAVELDFDGSHAPSSGAKYSNLFDTYASSSLARSKNNNNNDNTRTGGALWALKVVALLVIMLSTALRCLHLFALLVRRPPPTIDSGAGRVHPRMRSSAAANLDSMAVTDADEEAVRLVVSETRRGQSPRKDEDYLESDSFVFGIAGAGGASFMGDGTAAIELSPIGGAGNGSDAKTKKEERKTTTTSGKKKRSGVEDDFSDVELNSIEAGLLIDGGSSSGSSSAAATRRSRDASGGERNDSYSPPSRRAAAVGNAALVVPEMETAAQREEGINSGSSDDAAFVAAGLDGGRSPRSEASSSGHSNASFELSASSSSSGI